MNSLTAIDKMTSMQIAEVTGKRHDNIIRDIKDEIEKLEMAGISTDLKFEVRERQGIAGPIPYYST